MADAFRRQYPDLTARHFAVISNGFDPAQFLPCQRNGPLDQRFEVVHAGALYYGRSLLPAFLTAARQLIATDAAFARRVSPGAAGHPRYGRAG